MTEPAPRPVDIPDRVRRAAHAARDRKALDLRVLQLEKVSDFTDYFLICSGSSDRQVQAIAQSVDARLRERKVRPLHSEGEREGNWVLLDYGDFVVHVFQEDLRAFYALERLWSDAPDVTEEFGEGDLREEELGDAELGEAGSGGEELGGVEAS